MVCGELRVSRPIEVVVLNCCVTAIQMISKSEAVAVKLNSIASQVRDDMADYRREMLAGMRQ